MEGYIVIPNGQRQEPDQGQQGSTDDASSTEVLQASVVVSKEHLSRHECDKPADKKLFEEHSPVLLLFTCSDIRYKNKKIEGYVVIQNGQPQEPVYGSGTSNCQILPSRMFSVQHRMLEIMIKNLNIK